MSAACMNLVSGKIPVSFCFSDDCWNDGGGGGSGGCGGGNGEHLADNI